MVGLVVEGVFTMAVLMMGLFLLMSMKDADADKPFGHLFKVTLHCTTNANVNQDVLEVILKKDGDPVSGTILPQCNSSVITTNILGAKITSDIMTDPGNVDCSNSGTNFPARVVGMLICSMI